MFIVVNKGGEALSSPFRAPNLGVATQRVWSKLTEQGHKATAFFPEGWEKSLIHVSPRNQNGSFRLYVREAN